MAIALGLFTAAVSMGVQFGAANAEKKAAYNQANSVERTSEKQFSRDLRDLDDFLGAQAASIAENDILFEGSPLLVMRRSMEEGLEDARDRRDTAYTEAGNIRKSGRATAQARRYGAIAQGVGTVGTSIANYQNRQQRLGNNFSTSSSSRSSSGNSVGSYYGRMMGR